MRLFTRFPCISWVSGSSPRNCLLVYSLKKPPCISSSSPPNQQSSRGRALNDVFFDINILH